MFIKSKGSEKIYNYKLVKYNRVLLKQEQDNHENLHINIFL